MKEPIWLLHAAVLALHAECLQAFGGSDGVRDPGLLESALARPQHLFHYEQADLCALAAAYGHGIAKNHPFVDGNKRIGAALFLWFLEKNGALAGRDGERRLSDAALVALTLLIAESPPAEREVVVRIVTHLLQDRETERRR